MDIKTITVFLATVLAILGIGAWYNLVMKNPPQTATTVVEKPEALKTALLAGGCFWCVEADLEKLPGVVKVVSGYAGGRDDNPTYENYARNGHREVVEVTYDSSRLSYSELIYYHLKHIDPTDGQGSFHDRGLQYAPTLYYQNDVEKTTAKEVLAEIEKSGVFDKPLQVTVEARPKFYLAEEYHQDYAQKNPVRYKYYRFASGRDQFIKEHWGEKANIVEDISMNEDTKYPWEDFQKPDDETLRAQLTDIQYKVTQQDGTERAFDNPYDKNYEPGIYVDVVSGEPLYSSRDKFDSGTGWPSFVKPITPEAVTLHEDRKLFSVRTEVRSRYADSHVGHVFDDGPADRGGKRYCMNSAALRFIPKADMATEGYADFLQYVE